MAYGITFSALGGILLAVSLVHRGMVRLGVPEPFLSLTHLGLMVGGLLLFLRATPLWGGLTGG